jgi:sugar phosphate permease
VTSIVGDLFPPAERGRVLGKVKSGELVGAGIGFLLTGLLVSMFTWRSVFIAFAVLGALLAFRVARVPEPRRGGEGHDEHGERFLDAEDPLREIVEEEAVEPDKSLILHGDLSELPFTEAVGYIMRVRTLSLVILANAFGEFFFAALQVFGVLFLVEQFDISASTASLLIPAVGVAGLVGVIAGGQIGDRLVERHVLTGRIHVGAWSYLAVSVLFVPVLFAGSLAFALPFLVLAGAFLMAPVAPLEAARLDVVHPQLRGRAESARTVARVIAQAAAPLLFGVLSEAYGGGGEGLRNSFLTFLPLLALSSVLLWAATRRYPREVAAVQESTVATQDDGVA